jgi:hypothetical protein
MWGPWIPQATTPPQAHDWMNSWMGSRQEVKHGRVRTAHDHVLRTLDNFAVQFEQIAALESLHSTEIKMARCSHPRSCVACSAP